MANPTTQTVPNITGVNVGTSSVPLIGKNPTRNGLILTNLHATQTVSFTTDVNTPTSLGAGTITLAAATSMVIAGANFPFAWTAGINAIASGATTPVTITEF